MAIVTDESGHGCVVWCDGDVWYRESLLSDMDGVAEHEEIQESNLEFVGQELESLRAC